MDWRRQDYASDRRLRGHSDGSIERTLRELSYIERDLNKDPADLTRSELRAWLSNFTPNSASFRLRATRGFFKWLHEEGLRDEVITQGIKISTVEEPQTTATDEQIGQMIKSSRRSAKDAAICSLFVATGARRSEIGFLTFGDLMDYIDGSCIRISRSKTRVRIAMVTPDAVRSVRRWLREARQRQAELDPQVNAWLAANGPQTASRAVHRHSSGQLSPHAIRRWFVTTAASRGMSSASIGRQLGWSPATTNAMIGVYTKATASHLLADEYFRLISGHSSW